MNSDLPIHSRPDANATQFHAALTAATDRVQELDRALQQATDAAGEFASAVSSGIFFSEDGPVFPGLRFPDTNDISLEDLLSVTGRFQPGGFPGGIVFSEDGPVFLGPRFPDTNDNPLDDLLNATGCFQPGGFPGGIVFSEDGPVALGPLSRGPGAPCINFAPTIAPVVQVTIGDPTADGQAIGEAAGKEIVAAVYGVLVEEQRPGGLLDPEHS